MINNLILLNNIPNNFTISYNETLMKFIFSSNVNFSID